MTIDLVKGQRVPVGPKRLTLGLGWDPADENAEFDLDATACMLNDAKKLPADKYFVFYNNMTSPDGALALSKDDRTGSSSDGGDDEQIAVDLTKVAPEVTSIVFSASIYKAAERKQNFGQIDNSYIRIYNADTNEELCKFELCEDFSIETAVEFGRLYLRNGEWKFEATGTGHKGGLQSIIDKYRG